MREIKYRGVDLKTGKRVYGEVVKYRYGTVTEYWMHTLPGEPNSPLKPESISQLIGRDRDGAEIYEGDKIYIGTDVFTASFRDYGLIEQGKVKNANDKI